MMKTYTAFLLFLFLSLASHSQSSNNGNNGISDESFDYSTVGHFIFHEFDIEKNKPIDDVYKVPAYGARFIKKNEMTHPENDYKIYLIKVLDYQETNPKTGNKIKYEYENSPLIINVKDNEKLFWIKAETFDDLEENDFIRKRYHWKPQFAFGGSLSVPFKLRPEVDTFNMKITPSINLGGYLGLKQRLSRYKDIHLYIPIVTLGITTIGINDNNIIKETGDKEDTKDGLVLGRTFTVGLLLESNSFQTGFIVGWDKAAGEIGKNWIYNNKPWFTFSIGYSFFGKETGK